MSTGRADGKTSDDLPHAARGLLASERTGVLSSLSVHRPGYPYGSVTPYAPSRTGQPIILISTLAAHTKNLLADPRASLFVGDRAAADDQDAAGARMGGVDAFGFDVETAADRLRFDFPDEVATPDEVRRAVIALLKAARVQLG